jgi:transcriptional regulator of acetoin/glycerol metabolism
LFGDSADPADDRSGGKAGVLERAKGGILVLDEVGSLPLPLQARLVSALHSTCVQPHGDGSGEVIDIALISTTRQSLSKLAGTGGFRQDLLALVAAYTIELKPLRQVSNRPALVLAIWKQLVPPDQVERLTPALVAALTAYQWPGNFRQLVATLRALAVLAKSGVALDLNALPRDIRDPRAPAAPDHEAGLEGEVGLETVTLAVMRATLTAEGGNVSRAARRLGIHRSTFYRRLFGSEQSKS